MESCFAKAASPAISHFHGEPILRLNVTGVKSVQSLVNACSSETWDLLTSIQQSTYPGDRDGTADPADRTSIQIDVIANDDGWDDDLQISKPLGT